MQLWTFIETNAVAIITMVVTAVGAYFGARSYFLAEKKKEREEIARIKQLLVGSSEVSVQNLTEVIETLRSRVDRVKEDRDRLKGLLEEERERVEELEAANEALNEEITRAEKEVANMKSEVRSLKRKLDNAEEEVRKLSGGSGNDTDTS